MYIPLTILQSLTLQVDNEADNSIETTVLFKAKGCDVTPNN